MPFGVISINRFAILSTNCWSLDVNKMAPLNLIKPLFTDCIDSRSKWLVGSSKMSTLALESIIFDSMQRTFSPPDSTLAFFKASSPENNILPRKLRKNVSVSSSGEYCLKQSTKGKSLFSKNAELSFGKYDCDVVTPQ